MGMEKLEVTATGALEVMLAGMLEVMLWVMGRTLEVVIAAGLLMLAGILEVIVGIVDVSVAVAGDVTANIFPTIRIVAVIITTINLLVFTFLFCLLFLFALFGFCLICLFLFKVIHC